jgi:hypothetical protein
MNFCTSQKLVLTAGIFWPKVLPIRRKEASEFAVFVPFFWPKFRNCILSSSMRVLKKIRSRCGKNIIPKTSYLHHRPTTRTTCMLELKMFWPNQRCRQRRPPAKLLPLLSWPLPPWRCHRHDAAKLDAAATLPSLTLPPHCQAERCPRAAAATTTTALSPPPCCRAGHCGACDGLPQWEGGVIAASTSRKLSDSPSCEPNTSLGVFVVS